MTTPYVVQLVASNGDISRINLGYKAAAPKFFMIGSTLYELREVHQHDGRNVFSEYPNDTFIRTGIYVEVTDVYVDQRIRDVERENVRLKQDLKMALGSNQDLTSELAKMVAQKVSPPVTPDD